MLVKTKSGQLGRVSTLYGTDAKKAEAALKKLTNKIPVMLLNDDYTRILENGKPKNLLCDPKTLTLIGFID